MTATSVSVTAVIVTWNSARDVEAALRSLEAGMAGVGSWSVVVVDNASSDDTVERVERIRPGTRVIQTGGNLGYAAGLNAGVRAAAGSRAYLLLNPDLRLGPGSVAELLRLVEDDGVAIAVPRLLDDSGVLQPSLRRAPTILRAVGEAVLGGRRAGRFPALGELVTDPSAYRTRTTADWASGAAMLVDAAVVEDVGPWDESYFLYSEETDFALRVKDAGGSLCLCPDAVAVHIGGESHVSPALYTLLTRNRIRLYARRHGRSRAAAFTAAVALNELLRARDRLHRQALRALVTGSDPAPSRLRPARTSESVS